MNIILDTNVIISALCFPFSKPRQIFDLSKEIGIILFSEETFQELQTVLLKTKFDKYITTELRQQFLKDFKLLCLEVKIIEKIAICRDIKGDKFLELATSGFANYLVTGDSDLLVLNPFRNTQIIKPDPFLNELLQIL